MPDDQSGLCITRITIIEWSESSEWIPMIKTEHTLSPGDQSGWPRGRRLWLLWRRLPWKLIFDNCNNFDQSSHKLSMSISSMSNVITCHWASDAAEVFHLPRHHTKELAPDHHHHYHLLHHHFCCCFANYCSLSEGFQPWQVPKRGKTGRGRCLQFDMIRTMVNAGIEFWTMMIIGMRRRLVTMKVKGFYFLGEALWRERLTPALSGPSLDKAVWTWRCFFDGSMIGL